MMLQHGILVFISLLSLIQAQKPVKVVILAGQSNMVGHGSLDHLDALVNETGTNKNNEYRQALWNGTHYTVFSNVFIRNEDHYGTLTVGRDTGYAAPNQFGPEIMIGQVLSSVETTTTDNNSPVLLLKTAWGGKTLTVDFRPPSAGEGRYENVHPVQYGYYYRLMMQEIQDTLSNLTKYVPNNSDGTYELSGFIWFQGWNDMLNMVMVREYADCLADLIRDVRLDLQAPQLPFVVGELGMFGVHCQNDPLCDQYQAMRVAQQSVTHLPEFVSNTLFVPTAQYAVLNGTKTYNGVHHYFGRADSYFHMGQAMGRGLLKLWHRLRRSSPRLDSY